MLIKKKMKKKNNLICSRQKGKRRSDAEKRRVCVDGRREEIRLKELHQQSEQ